MLQRDIKSISTTATCSSDDLQYCCKHHESLVPLLTRMIRTATSPNKRFFYGREHFQMAAQDRSLWLTGRPCPTHWLWHAHFLLHSFQGSCFTAASGQLCRLGQPHKGSDKHETAHETTALRTLWHQWKQAKSTLLPEGCPRLSESVHLMACWLSQQNVHLLSKVLGKSNLHYCEQKSSLLEKRLPVSLLK